MSRSLLLIASTLAGAAAFAPVTTLSGSQTALQMADFSKEIGAQAPLGFFDPFGFMKDADQDTFNSFRKIEVKHGRVAMMAVLGHMVATKGDRMPGLEDCKVGLKGLTSVPTTVYVQLFLTVAILEIGYGFRQEEIEEIHLKKSGWGPETIAKKKAVELNNGRAAQMGILGLMTHECIDGNPYVLNSLLGAPVDF
jgi:hypothetical protein